MNNLKLINLHNAQDHYYELHKADCRDLAKKSADVYEVENIEEAREIIEGANDDYETSWSMDEHCKIFGCVEKVGA